jgi:tRNA A-37 threonylcarbamoyl transferase component Bud32
LERRIDRYRLLEEVGSGGMAVVYRGLDTLLGREVAVKVMHPHLAGREESRRRFSREARAVAKLRHPNIVEIWDFSGDDAPEAFIVTELIRGRTLRAFGETVGAKLPEIAALLVDVLAAALEHAHDHGVLHRDLKPENVMVSDAGELKLMDFGIARLLEADEKMTMTGALVGSPLHMPPEVIEGRESDARADVFSLGTILYWLVTGRMAFQAKTTTLTLRQILEGTYEDPRLLCPACSDRLAELVDRCLRRDPAERFATMAEVRAALAEVLAEAGIVDAGTELKAFFADPDGFAGELRRRLVTSLTARGEAFLAERRTPPALACFDRVLALDPENEAVARHLERLRRRQARGMKIRQAAVAAAALLVLGGAVYGGSALLESAGPGPEADTPEGIAAGEAGAAPGDAEPPATGFPEAAEGEAPGAGPPADSTPAPTAGVTAGPAGATSGGGTTGSAGPGRPLPGNGAAPGPAGDPPPGRSGDTTAVATAGASPAVPDAAPGGEPPPARGTPGDTRPEPAPALRRVTVAWSPPGPGVLLEVDGRGRDTARAPFWEGDLPVGSHEVHLSRDDCCEPERQTIVVPPGTGELPPFRFALQPRPAFLVIASPRDDLAVSVDGEPRGLLRAFPGGRVPVTLADGSRRLYVKEVEVTLASADGVQFTRTVVVRAGQESPVEVVLE